MLQLQLGEENEPAKQTWNYQNMTNTGLKKLKSKYTSASQFGGPVVHISQRIRRIGQNRLCVLAGISKLACRNILIIGFFYQESYFDNLRLVLQVHFLHLIEVATLCEYVMTNTTSYSINHFILT